MEPCDWCTWRHNSFGGVTAGQPRPNSSNVGGVTTCQVGHNSLVLLMLIILLFQHGRYSELLALPQGEPIFTAIQSLSHCSQLRYKIFICESKMRVIKLFISLYILGNYTSPQGDYNSAYTYSFSVVLHQTQFPKYIEPKIRLFNVGCSGWPWVDGESSRVGYCWGKNKSGNLKDRTI